MTTALNGIEVARKLTEKFPDSVASADDAAIVVKSESLYRVAEFLKNTPEFELDYLTNLVTVDYIDYFEVVYYLISIKHNHGLVLKTRCYERDKPVVPSVVKIWRSADFQEREAYDLMGIVFEGHPNLKRLFLWEGFVGHPLRRDYL